MKKALSSTILLNSAEDDKRLKAVTVLLGAKKKINIPANHNSGDGRDNYVFEDGLF